MNTDHWGIGDERIVSILDNLLGEIAAGLTDRDVLCKIITFVDTRTLLEMTLLENSAWVRPIEAALALPKVFRNHFPFIWVDAKSLRRAHNIRPRGYRYDIPPQNFTLTRHFQGLLRLGSEYNMPSRFCLVDKWPDMSNRNAPDRQENGMFIHVCRECGCTFRCAEREDFTPGDNGDCGGCNCLQQENIDNGVTFCSNKCYWDFLRPGGTLERIHRLNEPRERARQAEVARTTALIWAGKRPRP